MVSYDYTRLNTETDQGGSFNLRQIIFKHVEVNFAQIHSGCIEIIFQGCIGYVARVVVCFDI